MMPRWKYLTLYLSGTLDFPETVDRDELLRWAGKSITQQINEYAAQGWEVFDMNWVSEVEVVVTFRRPSEVSEHRKMRKN